MPVAPAVFFLVALAAALFATANSAAALFPALAAWFAWSLLLLPRAPALVSSRLPASPPSSRRLVLAHRILEGLRRVTPALLRLALLLLLVAAACLALARLFPTRVPLFFSGLFGTPAAVVTTAAAVPAGIALFAFVGFFLQTYAGLRAGSPGDSARSPANPGSSLQNTAIAWPLAFTAALLRATTVLLGLLAALLVGGSRLGFAVTTLAAIALIAVLAAWWIETGLRAA
ncbi:MAG: hypothetical protein H7067_02985, partial [Burkholderiales bacterium]|nr:hypothetical protein [Opitutaceae bacterium]